MDDNISYNPYKQAVCWGKYELKYLFPGSEKGDVYCLSNGEFEVSLEVVETEEVFLVYNIGRAVYAPVGGALSGPVVKKHIFSGSSEFHDVVEKAAIGFKFLCERSGVDVKFVDGLIGLVGIEQCL